MVDKKAFEGDDKYPGQQAATGFSSAPPGTYSYEPYKRGSNEHEDKMVLYWDAVKDSFFTKGNRISFVINDLKKQYPDITKDEIDEVLNQIDYYLQQYKIQRESNEGGPEGQFGVGGFFDSPSDVGKNPDGDFPSVSWMPSGTEDQSVDTNIPTTGSQIKKLIEKRSHCGPCSVLKQNIVQVFSDIRYADPKSVTEEDFLHLTKLMPPLDVKPFAEAMGEMISKVSDKHKDKIEKLKNYQVAINDVVKKLESKDISVVDKGVLKEAVLICVCGHSKDLHGMGAPHKCSECTCKKFNVRIQDNTKKEAEKLVHYCSHCKEYTNCILPTTEIYEPCICKKCFEVKNTPHGTKKEADLDKQSWSKGICEKCKKDRQTTIGYSGAFVCRECLEKERKKYYGKELLDKDSSTKVKMESLGTDLYEVSVPNTNILYSIYHYVDDKRDFWGVWEGKLLEAFGKKEVLGQFIDAKAALSFAWVQAENAAELPTEETIKNLPTLDVKKRIDTLLEDLNKETDPDKKKSIERHIERLKQGSLHVKAYGLGQGYLIDPSGNIYDVPEDKIHYNWVVSNKVLLKERYGFDVDKHQNPEQDLIKAGWVEVRVMPAELTFRVGDINHLNSHLDNFIAAHWKQGQHKFVAVEDLNENFKTIANPLIGLQKAVQQRQPTYAKLDILTQDEADQVSAKYGPEYITALEFYYTAVKNSHSKDRSFAYAIDEMKKMKINIDAQKLAEAATTYLKGKI